MAHTLSYMLHAFVVLSVSVFITIDAANPMFLVPNPDGSTAPRSVSEDETVGRSILTLEGQDTDGDNLTFSIVSQNPTSPPFELESRSGLLKVPSGLDYEFIPSYTFIFGVRDGSTTTNSISYVVNIVDVNEPPVFQPTNPVPEEVIETVSIGTIVITVTATDPDGPGNTLTYRIDSGKNTPFALNTSTGVITVSERLNASTNPTYNLIIQASDGTFNAVTPCTVIITVIAGTTTAQTTTVDNCASSPYLNGGTCINAPNSYMCTCADGCTGTNRTSTTVTTLSTAATAPTTETTGPGGVDEDSKCTLLCIGLSVGGTLIVCFCICICICILRKRCQRETAASPTRHVKPRNEYFPGKIYNANKLPIESETAPSLMPLVATRNEDFPEKGYITKKSQKRKREKRLLKESETALSPTPLVETRNEEFSRISPIIHA